MVQSIKRTIKSASMLSFIIASIILILLALYWTLDNKFEKLLLLIVGFSILIPIFITTINFIINLSFPKENSINNKTFGDNKYKEIKGADKSNKKYKEKTVQTEGYREFNNLLKASVQNKLMDRECILKLKYELINLLGIHMEVYKDFDFQNDMHCIYVLSKSSKLTTNDYEYLSKFLSDNLIFP